MSCLLNISANKIDMGTEYGYTTRQFAKTPRVPVTDNFKSCLFLFYKQHAAINNRIKNYRNHFNLYTNRKNTIIIVKTETTLIIPDNNSILTYDTLTLSDKEADRFRTNNIGYASNNWDVSFDRITYSAKKPESLSKFELLISGEWWFFDKGVVLLGKTSFVPRMTCLNVLIYYELHPRYRVFPSLPFMSSIKPPWSKFSQTEDFFNSHGPLPDIASDPLKNLNPFSFNIDTSAKNFSLGNGNFANKTTALNSEINEKSQETTNNTSPNTAANSPENSGQNGDDNNNSSSNNNEASAAQRYTELSSLNSKILPTINSTFSPFITKNDKIEYPNIQYKAIMPSLYWFHERERELMNGNISYFLPVNKLDLGESYKW